MYAKVDNPPNLNGRVTRLNPYQTPIHYLDVGEPDEEFIDQFTGLIPQEAVCQKLKVSSKTLVQYRQVALGYDGQAFDSEKGIPDYKQSASDRSPDFVERKADAMIARMSGGNARDVYPDEPPFTDYEVWCLIQIAKLYKRMRRRKAVETYIKNRPNLFTKEKFVKCHKR